MLDTRSAGASNPAGDDRRGPAGNPGPATGPAASKYMSGIQALVHLPMLQRLRDQAAGLDTAGFVSG